MERRPDGGSAQPPLVPSRRARARDGREREDAVPEDEADLERGRTVALLGTLGRMQLRLDVMARQQQEGLDRVLDAVAALDRRLAVIEAIALDEAGQDLPPDASGA